MMLLALLACTLDAPPPPGLDDFGPVPAFTLTDQDGATVTPATLSGKVWVADFMFTSCPDICPILSAHMAEIQARYASRDDLHLVSFSVDPATDTPPVLKEYGSRFGAKPGRWTFLTGPLDDVKKTVVDGFKQSMENLPATDLKPATILHGSRFVVVDRRGHMRAFPDPAEPGKTELYAVVDAVLAGK